MPTPTVYAVKIDWDEDGCHLMLATEDGRQQFLLDDPEQVYDAVMGGVWPWLYEREQAFKQFRARVNGDDAEAAFACVDPEGAWADMLRDHADQQRKAAKEGAA